jgi:hypothetical protein
MPRKPRLQTRAENDTANAVEAYADDHDIGESEAVRRLIRAGLIENGYADEIDVPTRRGTLEQTITVKGMIATLLIAVATTYALTLVL